MKKIKKKKFLTFWQRVAMTILILVFCRALSSVPTPFTNPEYIKQLTEQNSGFGFLNILSGNSLEQMSFTAMGINPYITASIVLQLLAVVFPRIKDLQKGMADDRNKYEWITIAFGFVISAVTGLSMAMVLGRRGYLSVYTWYSVATVVIMWTLGTVVLSLLGKLITDRYIGNGISLILTCNILSSYPQSAYVLVRTLTADKNPVVGGTAVAVMAAFTVVVCVGTVYITECEKRLDVIYSGKMPRSTFIMDRSKMNIPVKLCPGGVVPVIFAQSIFTMFTLIPAMTGKDVWALKFFETTYWFKRTTPYFTAGAILYVVMIFYFSFYYTDIEINPTETANTLRQKGGTLPGIRPGRPTAERIEYVQKGIVFAGAIMLSAIAILPIVLSDVLNVPRIAFLGTSAIIVTSVVVETEKTLRAEAKMYISKKKERKRGEGFLR